MAIPTLNNASLRLTDCIYFGDPVSSSVGSGFVATTRTISTTLPLTGGGDLSADRTLNINQFAGSAAGTVPTSLGGVVNFLRADGTWATPPTFGAAAAGYAPASGGGAVNYLRADGTWAPPAGTGIAGLTTDFYPVATGATSIGNGRISQAANTLTFFTAYSDAANYAGIAETYDAGTTTFSLTTAALTAGVGADCSLKLLAGGTGTAALTLGGAALTAVGAFGLTGNATITGKVAVPESAISLANGLNSNVDLTGKTTRLRATGPTNAFSLGGFTGGTDGQCVVLYNTTAQALTIVNESASSTAANRIYTGTGANIVLPAYPSVVTFWYSGTDSRWILGSTSLEQAPALTAGYIPWMGMSGALVNTNVFWDNGNTRLGIATGSSIAATVDINGTLSTRSYNQGLVNGLNSNLPAPTTSYMRITGPTGAFSVGGVTTVANENGKHLTIHNTTSQAMTIVHEDASSTAAYRINTLTAANVVFPARQSVVHLIYSTTTSRWILDEANPNTAGGATTQVQSNLSGSLYGDSGLTVAGSGTTKTLTLGTQVTLSTKTLRQLELGVPGALAAAQPYLLTATSARGGTDSNTVGGTLTISGGAGTGTGGGGNTVLATAAPAAAGNTQNNINSRLALVAIPAPLTDSVACKVMSLDMGSLRFGGGTLYYTIYASDGVDVQARRGRVLFVGVNKGGTITPQLGTPEEIVALSAGTLTATITMVDAGGDVADLLINAVSSLTVTTFEAWVSLSYDGIGGLYL